MKFVAIRENHLYAKAYAKGKRAVMPALAVYLLPDYTAEALKRANPLKERVNRIGLAVPKKKFRTAVSRNRVKRILREAYRTISTERAMKKGFLIVLAARERAAEMKSTELKKEMQIALNKLQLFL